MCRAYEGIILDKPYSIRFKLPADLLDISFTDLIHGPITIVANQLDDFIIIRRDGMPMYNFAVVVDDAYMHISHIIRGEEHIVNTPKQILLYKACGYMLPEFAHIPLILGPTGEKLSKRDGAVSVLDYKLDGYLKEALISYLARLGWSHGDQEIFSKEELVQHFSLEHVGKKGSIFDSTKLKWVNNQFLKNMGNSAVVDCLVRDLGYDMRSLTDAFGTPQLLYAIDVYKERVATLKELYEELRAVSSGLQEDQFLYHSKEIEEGTPYLSDLVMIMEKMVSLDKKSISDAFSAFTKTVKIKFPIIGKPLRLALSGKIDGPSIAEIVLILGISEAIKRIKKLQKFLIKFGGKGQP